MQWPPWVGLTDQSGGMPRCIGGDARRSIVLIAVQAHHLFLTHPVERTTPICGGSTPKAPDPVATAAAQAKLNKEAAVESAKLSAIDQSGPFGSTTFQRRADGTPISQTVNLSPDVQKWLDSQFGSATQLQDATSRQLGYLPQDKFQLPTGPDATGYAREAFGDAVLDSSKFDPTKIAAASYEQSKSLFQPDIDAARKQAGITLAQRGINPGDEIYQSEMDRLDRGANTAYAGAARQAQLDAGNEQTRAMGNAVTARNFGSNQYQTNLSNDLLERNQPFSEAAALMGTTPSFQTPSFVNTAATNVNAPDYTGAVNSSYNAQMQNYNANQQKNSGLWNTIGSIGSTAATMFSDERLKEDREPGDDESVLVSISQMPIDRWEYKPEAQEALNLPGGPRVGPMAADWSEKFGGDGSTIDIPDAIGRLLSAVKALEKRTSGGMEMA